MVEVFKTDITNKEESDKIKKFLLEIFPCSSIHFDLEDCDNILRIEHTVISINDVIALLKTHNYYCQVLN